LKPACATASISIRKKFKGSLQTKLKGASIWPFNACNEVPTGCLSHAIIGDVPVL